MAMPGCFCSPPSPIPSGGPSDQPVSVRPIIPISAVESRHQLCDSPSHPPADLSICLYKPRMWSSAGAAYVTVGLTHPRPQRPNSGPPRPSRSSSNSRTDVRSLEKPVRRSRSRTQAYVALRPSRARCGESEDMSPGQVSQDNRFLPWPVLCVSCNLNCDFLHSMAMGHEETWPRNLPIALYHSPLDVHGPHAHIPYRTHTDPANAHD
ncbi:hypothetical protein C8Q73DRAFT_710372 [Cubamyces lactineus]|nr:hypothetical protein C8Q73DRAFT_710372 [Cubamyces lactineus]